MRPLLLALLTLLCHAANAQFLVREPSPHYLSAEIERMGQYLDTKGPISVTIRPCGFENAWWSASSNEIIYCQEVVEHILKQRQAALQTGQLNPEAINKTAYGEALFVFLHELGHALISRHQIPFSGHEEDVADQFAAWMLMRRNDANLYIGATNFFAEPSRMFRVFGNRQLTDEHSLNIQRRAQLVCWGYGRDPNRMRHFAEHLGLTESRLQRCAEEYRQLMLNTPRLFSPVYKTQG